MLWCNKAFANQKQLPNTTDMHIWLGCFEKTSIVSVGRLGGDIRSKWWWLHNHRHGPSRHAQCLPSAPQCTPCLKQLSLRQKQHNGWMAGWF